MWCQASCRDVLFGPAQKFQFTSMIIERLKRPATTYVLNNLINLQNFNTKNPTLRLTLSSQPHTKKQKHTHTQTHTHTHTHLKANIEAPNAGPAGRQKVMRAKSPGPWVASGCLVSSIPTPKVLGTLWTPTTWYPTTI